MNENKILVITGPTAVGKTQFSYNIASYLQQRNLKPVIINIDAMAVYQDMVIGTAAPSQEEKEIFSHYLFNFLSPAEEFNILKYRNIIDNLLNTLLNEHFLPIIVGGSVMYVSSLIENLQYPEITENFNLRENLKKEYLLNPQFFYDKVKMIDPEACQKIALNDLKKLVRIMEIYRLSGNNLTYYNNLSRRIPSPYNFCSIFLNDERQNIYTRINKRVNTMKDNGLLEEAEFLRQKYPILSSTAKAAIAYEQCFKFLDSLISWDEAAYDIALKTRHYAKRQISWLKSKPYIKEYSCHNVTEIIKKINEFLF